MIDVVLNVIVYGVITLLVFFRVVVQWGKDLPHIWFEAKTLQAWFNTALICMFALFTYPFSLLILLIQIVFLPVRPLGNPEKLPLE